MFFFFLFLFFWIYEFFGKAGNGILLLDVANCFLFISNRVVFWSCGTILFLFANTLS